MKILCLIDWALKPGDRWLWKYLPANSDQVDFLYTTGVADRFPKWGKLIAYYPAHLWLGLKALYSTRRTKYDLVVAWEGKNGFLYALLRRLVGQKHPPLVILNFNYRGLIRHFGALARFGMLTVAHSTVITHFEVEYYRRVLALDPKTISFCPFPWYDSQWIRSFAKLAESNKFILASGRSYRDYATLAEAVRGLDIKVIIIARQFNLAGVDLPDNVETMDLLPLKDYQMLLHQSQFVVLPLMELPHAAGDSHIVQSMSAGKAIIASHTPSPETYVEPGVTGMLVAPGNAEEMREAILYLWQNPEEAARMGCEARRRYEENYTFEKVSKQIYNVLLKVHHAKSG